MSTRSRRVKIEKKYSEEEEEDEFNENDDEDDGDVREEEAVVRRGRKVRDSHSSVGSKRKASLESTMSVIELDSAEALVAEEETKKIVCEAGQILLMKIEDFMCHHSITIDFCRNVNFISGLNGSGKSAVVAAIQICLGGSARHTGRGNNLASLIREGSDGPAILTIRLLNEGPDAYKPKEYGNRISVRRRIYKNRTDYALLSVDDKVISTSPSELEKLTTQFNICVSNPCCVLTQEESKKFINGKEKEKYDFFLKATGLAQTLETINFSEGFVTESEEQFKSAEVQLECQKEVVAKLRKNVEMIKEISVIKNAIDLNKTKLLWHGVYVIEKQLNNEKLSVEKIEKDIKQLKNEISDMEQSGTESQNMEEIKAKIAEKESELQVKVQEGDALRKQQTERQKEISGAERGVNSAISSRTELQDRLKGVHKQIKELEDKALAASQGNEREIRSKLETNQMSLQQISQRISFLEEKRRQILGTLANLKNENSSLTSQMQSIDREKRNLEDQLREMSKDSSAGRLTFFGKEMPSLLREISQTNFSGPVIGPLGMFLEIREGFGPMSQAVEKIIGGRLNNFIVTNAEDMNKLKSLKNRIQGLNLTIIIQPNAPRYSVNSSPNPFVTIRDCINITGENSHLIFNCLIDHARIDQIAICESYDYLSHNLITKHGEKKFLSDNINSCVLFDGTVVRYRKGNESYENNRDSFRRLLQGEKAKGESIITEIKERISESMAEKDNISRQFHEIKDKIAYLENGRGNNQKNNQNNNGNGDDQFMSLDMIQSEMKSQMDAQKRFSMVKMKLESELNELVSANSDTNSGFISDLKLECEELQEGIASLNNQINEKQTILISYKDQLKSFANNKNFTENGIKEIKNVIMDLEKKYNKFVDHVENKKNKISSLNKKLTNIQTVYIKNSEGLKDLEQTFNNKYDDAMEQSNKLIPNFDGNPITLKSNETENYFNDGNKKLQQEMNHKKAKLGLKENSNNPNFLSQHEEEITKKYEVAKDSLDVLQQKYQRLVNHITELKDDLAARKSNWTKTLVKSSKTVKREFNYYLQLKGFKGSVDFDHNEKKLKLLVMTDQQDKSSVHDDARGMSGGERSYSTMCLLLALGRVIETPFRLMDEYDVFLDESSRKLTLTTLRDFALMDENKGRQLFIVTPNSLAGVVTTPQVRIKVMTPPARANSSRGPQQTVIES